MPEEIAIALDMGLVRTGPSFHQYRWMYLRTIVETAARIRGMSVSRREQLIGEPWRFRDWLLKSSEGLAQRHALLHLLYPDTFEAIISVADKRQILERLGNRLASVSGNQDRDLFDLRRTMAPEFGPRYDYYRPPVVELWR
jgi:5-methylcytosine-specific restriction enzyme B